CRGVEGESEAREDGHGNQGTFHDSSEIDDEGLRSATYADGTANKVTRVESPRPPMTARASGFWSSAPAPRPSARGSRPKRVQRVVIRIGRRRTRAAWATASAKGSPPAWRRWA